MGEIQHKDFSGGLKYCCSQKIESTYLIKISLGHLLDFYYQFSHKTTCVPFDIVVFIDSSKVMDSASRIVAETSKMSDLPVNS